MRYKYKDGEKLTRFSIRKYHFGAASVAVASLIFFGGGMSAKAENIPVSHDTQNSGNIANGDKNASGNSGKQATADSKPITVDVPQAALPTTKVDKTELNKLSIGLKTAIESADSEKISSISKDLNKVLENAKKLLENKNATAEEVKTQVEELKKATEKLKATVAEADKKAEEEKKAKESEKDRSTEAEASNREASTPARSVRGRRGGTTEVQPKANESATPKLEAATSNKEATPKALPTYANGTDNYALADEMRNIVKYLKDNGADAAKIAVIKENYDKLNEKLGLTDDSAVLSEEDFKKALADLKQARDYTEGFLANKDNGGRTEPPKPEAVLNRRERAAGQDRDGSNEYKNSREYYFEDGRKGVSPYDRYTYVFYTSRQSGVTWDGVKRSVEESRDFIYAHVTPTSNGFKWDIYINRARYDLSDTVGWFTLPKGVNVVGNSVTVSWSNSGGNHAISPNDGRLETALSQAGLLMVTKGTTQASGIDKRNSGYSKNWNSNDIKALATTGGVSGNNPYRFDLLNNDNDGKALQGAKINAIYNNNGDLYYFQQGADRTAYHISFETTGITKKQDLIYAVGMKGERVDNTAQPPVRVRFIANQWSAKTALEKTDADEYSPIITYPAYIVKQGEYKNQKYGYNEAWFRHPERTDKLLNYGDQSYTKSDFDANNYYHFEARNGKSSETILYEADARGFNKNFRMYKPDGTEISKHDMGNSGADVPGDFEYTWKWTFTDNSKASEHVRFIVVPKEPRLVTDLTNAAGRKNVEIKAANGTNGFKMELYRKVGNVLTKVSEAIAGANGEATFTLDNNKRPLILEVGDYVVKTVADLNEDYIDYAGITHRQEEGLRSGESNVVAATDGAPPVVRMVGSADPLPDTRPADNAPAIYEVTQGERFAPRLEAFDNLGVIKKFELVDFPAPLRTPFKEANSFSESNSYEPIFNGNIPANTAPGVYTRTITVSDGVTGDKTYYFKYKVLPVAPTITTPQNQGGTLVSTDRSISGTGIAGSTITVTLQDGTTGTTTVDNQGNWTYTLKQNEKLTQNTKQDANTKADRGISITQSKNGAESRPATVDVQLARAISIDTPVQAGRDITVKVPHDAGLLYVQVKNGNNTVYEYGVRKVGNSWQITDTAKANLTELRVTDGKNISEKVLTFHIKDPKNNIPFTLSATNDVTMRVHYDNNAGNPSDPTGENAGWVTAAKPTNTAPTITVNAPDTHNYTADGSLTMAGLKGLVTVVDREDDADKTVGNRVGDNFNLTIRKGNQNVTLSGNDYLKKGEYTLTYTTTDAAGARVERTHNITVSSLAESKGASITYPLDTAKVVYGNNDVENGNFKPAIKQAFADKLTEVNRNNSNLPTGVTFVPGATNDKAKVVVATFPDGSTVDISHERVAKPEAPTVTSTTTENRILSTDKTLTGSGIAGAKIKVIVNNKVLKETTVGSNGEWSVTLDKGFNSNNVSNLGQFPDPDIVKVTQSVAGIESSENNVRIVLGESKIHPSDDTVSSVFAGAKKLTVEIPHDAGMFYVKYKYREKTNASEQDSAIMRELGFKRETIDGPWIATKPEYGNVTETPVKGKFTTTVTIDMKENIKESTKDSEKAAVIANIKERGYSSPTGWKEISVTNEKPTLAATFQGDKKVVEYGSSLNLNDLVRASDKEDDKNLTRGNGTSLEILSVNDNTTNKQVDTNTLGRYTVKYRATDSQGKQSDEKTITVEVVDTVKPVVKLVGDDGRDITLTEGTADANLPKVTVYRGEKANVTIKASDNTGKIQELRGNGMPNGIWFNKNPNADSEVWLTSDNATETNPLSHTITGVVETGNRIEEKIVTVTAKDKTNPANVTTVKFKMVVKEQKEKYTPTAPTNAVNFNNLGTSVTSAEDVQKITDLVNVPNLSEEATNAGGVRKALKNNGEITKENGKKVVTVTVTYPDRSIDEVTVPVAQNYNVVARPIINFKHGEALTDEVKRSLVQLQDGENKVDIPSDARVTFENLDTSMSENDGKTVTKNAIATITFADSTVKKVTVNYKVLNTFPIAHTIYDFKGVARNDGDSDFYRNTGKNIPDNMTWIYKASDGVEKSATGFRDKLKADAANVGSTTYTFTGKYNYGRFTDNPSDADRLKHEGTLVHKVFDIAANTTKLTVAKGHQLTAAQAKDAVMKAQGSEDLPTGTTYEWVENPNTNTPGVRTYKVKVTLPPSQTGNDQPTATQVKPSKTIDVTVNVKPTAPTVTPATNGDVTVTPANETNVNKVEVTYTPADTNRLEDNGDISKTTHTPTKIVASKGANNKWTITEGDKVGVTINGDTGAITLEDHIVKDLTSVSSTDSAQDVSSDSNQANANNGEQDKPTIGLNNTLVEVGKAFDLSLDLSDGTGVGVDDANIKVTVPKGVTYDARTKSIKGTLSSVTKNDITVRVLDKNGNKAEKTISIAAVKVKPIYAIKDSTIPNVATASNFVEMPAGLTASWKDNSRPTTTAVGNTTKTVTVSAEGYNAINVDIPVTIYPKVTYRKVGGKEVKEYNEIVGQPLTSSVWGTGGHEKPVAADFYVEFEGGTKPEGTTIKFKDKNPASKDKNPASPSTTAGITTETIVVTYPNEAGTIEKPVTFKTYGNEPKYEDGKDSVETIVGSAFAKTSASDYVKPSSTLANPSGTAIGWGNGYDSPNPVNKPQDKIGRREENVNVWYGYGVLDTREERYVNRHSDQNIKVTLDVKPQAPRLTANQFQGKAGTKPEITVNNLPTAAQLTTGLTVKVQLKDAAGTVVAEKTVAAGTESTTFAEADYRNPVTLGQQLTANVVVSGTYQKTEKTDTGTRQVPTTYSLVSDNSNSEQVTPQKPTFDTATVTSTSRTLSGTLGGFDATNRVVKVHLNDENNTVLSSENNGGVTINGNTWTATLPATVKLRQSVAKNGETTMPPAITVENTVTDGTVSTRSDNKAVEMGDYSVASAVAGSKHIDITVPHDAKRVELRFHNSVETGDKVNSIVLVRGTDGWHTEATRTDSATVTNANGYVGTITSTPSTTNPSENNIRIALNEQSGTAKLHIKEENANGDNTESYGSGLGLRVYNQPETGQAPSATGKWKVVGVTNTAPNIVVKNETGRDANHRKIYDSGTTLTADLLKDLVTVTDAEDSVTPDENKPFGTGNVKVVSGLPATTGTTPAGRYTVVLKAVDSQGKESDPLTVYVGVVSKDVKYQPQLNGQNLGEAKVIPVEGEHAQGDSISYTPGEVTVDNKVYVPVTTEGHSVTLTDQPQTQPVEYKLKDASTAVKYQPQLNGQNLGEAKVIPVEGEHAQGDSISYTPGEVTVDNKV
ncbi:YSIRK-type signal peptide-containing protein, partial [Gemella haemolysans]|uniref:YSIRK-type signal peptide-containing protein n=1 Tax=Gemella haemolysans TaxID=1379 RepID=UPI0019590FDF